MRCHRCVRAFECIDQLQVRCRGNLGTTGAEQVARGLCTMLMLIRLELSCIPSALRTNQAFLPTQELVSWVENPGCTGSRMQT